MKIKQQDIKAFGADWKAKGRTHSTFVTYSRFLNGTMKQYATLGVDEVEIDLYQARDYVASFHSGHESRFAARALKAYGKWSAGEYGEVDDMLKLHLPAEPPVTHVTVATSEDVQRLLATCKRTSDPDETFLALRDAAMIHVLASTGMRRGEVMRMKCSDIDSDGVVSIHRTKNGEPRKTMLSEDALRAIRRYRRVVDGDQFFPNLWLTTRRSKLSDEAARKAIKRRATAAGVDVTAHSFRRGFAVNWLSKDGSETYLRKVAGWKSPSMVARYVSMVAETEALREQKRLQNA